MGSSRLDNLTRNFRSFKRMGEVSNPELIANGRNNHNVTILILAMNKSWTCAALTLALINVDYEYDQKILQLKCEIAQLNFFQVGHFIVVSGQSRNPIMVRKNNTKRKTIGAPTGSCSIHHQWSKRLLARYNYKMALMLILSIAKCTFSSKCRRLSYGLLFFSV